MQIASLQVQYSLVDRRAERDMIPLCKANSIKVYTYGSLLGGFLSENWLGKPEPDIRKVPNRSLVKYKLIIDDWGGWGRFQAFLRQLHELANARNCTIPQLATSSVLHSERVDAIIVGLSPTNYERQNAELANLPGLNGDDLEKVWSWDCPLEGSVYELERTSGRHAGIMKYNLNRDSAQVPAQGKHG
jgi:aryl-alcohol dehydrogenase-like predicted oxidoreductase